jgi:hypothetical protein
MRDFLIGGTVTCCCVIVFFGIFGIVKSHEKSIDINTIGTTQTVEDVKLLKNCTDVETKNETLEAFVENGRKKMIKTITNSQESKCYVDVDHAIKQMAEEAAEQEKARPKNNVY